MLAQQPFWRSNAGERKNSLLPRLLRKRPDPPRSRFCSASRNACMRHILARILYAAPQPTWAIFSSLLLLSTLEAGDLLLSRLFWRVRMLAELSAMLRTSWAAMR